MFGPEFGKAVVGALWVVAIILVVVAWSVGLLFGWAFL